jgi:carbon dioxide concentrating mechanism protein CcmL
MGVVKGQVVSTQKDPNLVGAKLLIVQQVDHDHKAIGDDEVAVDMFGAGVGEYVLLCHGSPARALLDNPKAPVDLVVVGIIDTVQT